MIDGAAATDGDHDGGGGGGGEKEDEEDHRIVQRCARCRSFVLPPISRSKLPVSGARPLIPLLPSAPLRSAHRALPCRGTGYLAAAGLYALQYHRDAFVVDHEMAQLLSRELVRLGFRLLRPVETNMVFAESPMPHRHGWLRDTATEALRRRGVLIMAEGPGESLRLVTHRQTREPEIQRLTGAFEALLRRRV